MTKYRAEMHKRLDYVRLPATDVERLKPFTQVRYVLVVTEDWCGDAVFNIPVVAQMVAAMPNADLRVMVRSAHAALQAHYAERNILHVPVVTFLDAAFNELAVWVERPQRGGQLFEEWKAARPDFLAIRYGTDLTPEDKAARLAPYYARLIEDMFTWYDGDENLQQATVDEILLVLAQAE